MSPLQPWETRCLALDAHEELSIAPRPEEALVELGYRRSLGTPKGQRADYRRPLEDGRGLHVRVYADHMTVHWDRTALAVSPVGHLLDDARGMTLTGGATLLALLLLPFL